jgi:hypothetical protein
MADPVKRLNYFNGQFLRDPDFNDEQDYHMHSVREHVRLQHTPGIAEGLDIPPPPSGATAVTVNAGVAFDDLGRRIVLADNQQVELAAQPSGQAVYITIAYGESQTDPTNETGIAGNTRWTEAPVIGISTAAPANPTETLVIALVQRTGTVVGAIDTSGRLAAGVVGGDLQVKSVTLTSGSIAQAGWVKAQLGAAGRADLGGSLRVTGDLIVTGTIQGDIAVGTVQAGDLVDNAVLSAKLAEADGTTAQDTNSGAGVKTNHIQDGAVTLQKLAPAVRPVVSVAGVANPGADIALLAGTGTAVTITPDNVNKRITIGETHSMRTDNPHATTAAQVGALALTGGTVSGNVQVNANLGVNTVPAHRMHVVGGDELDNQTYGVVSEVTTGASATITTAFNGSTISSGGGTLYGVNLGISGSGGGAKYGVIANIAGEGTKYGAQFSVNTATGTSSAQTQGIYTAATTAGTGAAVGIASTASTSNTGSSTALSGVASATAGGSANGLYVSAAGDGAGQKTGMACWATGADGGKTAAQFNASTSLSTSSAFTQGINVNSSTSGTGTVYGGSISASGDGTGFKLGLYSNASGADGTKYGAQINATTSGATSSAYTLGLYTQANNSGTGPTYGAQIYGFANTGNTNSTFGVYAYANNNGSGPVYALYSTAGGGGTGTKYAGYFNGNVFVGGTISTSGPKPFFIDHPLDPYKKTLRHCAVESPEELCMYRGVVELDRSGKGTVKMPEYFAALTKEEEATVTLTAIGKEPFATSYEWAKKFASFTVYGQAGAEVSYIVLANRDDPAVLLLRRPVEEDKSKQDRGKLMFPEAYGEKPEKGIAPPPSANDVPAPTAQVEKENAALRERMQREQTSREAEHQRSFEDHKKAEAQRLRKQAAVAAQDAKLRK